MNCSACRFKKSVNRAGTTIMQKTGQVERTNDREMQEEEARFKTWASSLLSYALV